MLEVGEPLWKHHRGDLRTQKKQSKDRTIANQPTKTKTKDQSAEKQSPKSYRQSKTKEV